MLFLKMQTRNTEHDKGREGDEEGGAKRGNGEGREGAGAAD